jgi:hypothetical protein
VALVTVAWGLRYIVTEPLIFEPGGWFALDGRRVLEAAQAWRDSGDPYSVNGFVYSPVAVLLAVPLTAISPAIAVIGWIVASGTFLVLAVLGATRRIRILGRFLAAAAVLLFIPTIADLVLANVTIALVVASWAAIGGSRFRSGVALGILAAAFPKPLVIPLILWLVINRPWVALGVMTTGALMCALSALVLGISEWGRYLQTLANGGGINLSFTGNYGISAIAPQLAVLTAIAAGLAFLWLLVRGGPAAGLAAATAAGVFIAPYAGIYAALPMLLVLPTLAVRAPVSGIILTLVAVLTAPWSPIAAAGLMLRAVWLRGHVVVEVAPG